MSRCATARSPTSRSNIFEPPRFFEALLRGRRHSEAPDITARICGICPVAYQMSACAAIEDACGVSVGASHRGPAQAAVLRGVDPEPRAARLPAPRPRLPRLRGRRRACRARPGGGRAGPRAQADRQPAHGDGRRAGRPSGQRPGRRLLSRSRSLSGPRSRRAAAAGPGRRPGDVEWVAGFEFPDVESDYRFVALRADGRLPHRVRPGRVL